MRAAVQRDRVADLRAYAEKLIAQQGADSPSCDGGTVREAVMAALDKYDPEAKGSDTGSSYDVHIQMVVASAPPFTPGQIDKLQALLGYRGQSAADAGLLASQRERAERAREERADRLAAQRAIQRRKDPADIAIEMLTRRLAAVRKAAPDPIVENARRIADQTRMPFAEAYANARAIAAQRELDRKRRVEHADGHMWCVASECPSAWQEGDES